MSKSPGHQEHPDHQVREERVDHRIQVRVNGHVVADSTDLIRVVEDGHPPRLYFPRSDVTAELEPTETASECPFKGTARYFIMEAGGELLDDAAWSYEDPYDEHRALKGRVAFYEEKFPAMKIGEAD